MKDETTHLLATAAAGIAARWDIVVDAPFTGGQGSWVAPARDSSGRDLVLKVGRTHQEARDEAAGLRLWAGRGTVRVGADLVDSDADVTALLLERVRPGTELGRLLPEAEQDVVIAGLLRRLWIDEEVLEPGHGIRSLPTMCEQWAREHDDDVRPGLDPGLVRAGLELWRTLPASADRQVLLLTDLHAGNVLAAEREPWLVIDPKPYVGDPTYDCVQHLLNCTERLHTDPRALVDRMARLCGVDAERLRHWLFSRCVIEVASWPELGLVAAELAD